MNNVMKISFEDGEIKTPDKAHSSTVKLGNVTMSKTTLQPGWSWSSCIKPILSTITSGSTSGSKASTSGSTSLVLRSSNIPIIEFENVTCPLFRLISCLSISLF